MILSVCFDLEKTLGLKLDLVRSHLLFFNTLTVTFLLKHYSIKKNNIPVMFVNVGVAMFLKRFSGFQHFEPHVSETFASLKNVYPV